MTPTKTCQHGAGKLSIRKTKRKKPFDKLIAILEKKTDEEILKEVEKYPVIKKRKPEMSKKKLILGVDFDGWAWKTNGYNELSYYQRYEPKNAIHHRGKWGRVRLVEIKQK